MIKFFDPNAYTVFSAVPFLAADIAEQTVTNSIAAVILLPIVWFLLRKLQTSNEKFLTTLNELTAAIQSNTDSIRLFREDTVQRLALIENNIKEAKKE